MRVPTLLYIRMLAGGANQIPGTPVPLNGQANAVVIGRIVELCSGAQLLCYGCNTGASGVSIGHTRLKEGSHLRRLQPESAVDPRRPGSPQRRQPSTTAATPVIQRRWEHYQILKEGSHLRRLQPWAHSPATRNPPASSKKAAIYDGCNRPRSLRA